MRTSDLVFIGIKGAVMALNRAKGQQEWVTRLKGSDFVNIILQQEAVLASCHGEIFSLDPLTGEVLWHNPLKGLESGWPRIATEHNQRSGTEPLLAEKRRRDAQAASMAVASTTATACSSRRSHEPHRRSSMVWPVSRGRSRNRAEF